MSGRYKHTQTGYLMLSILGTGMLFISGLILVRGGNWIAFAVLLILAVCSVLFASLTIEIEEDILRFKFGPGVFHKEFLLNDIEDCEVVRNPWYYGWGIRLTPHGWLYNVSGFSAVQISLKNGKQFRLGTDTPQELCQAIKQSL